MKMIDIVRRAGRSLRQAKARTLLTSLAIGVGAFTITLSLAGGQGGREYADAIVKSNTDVREITVTQATQDVNSGIQEYNGGVSGGSPFGSAIDPVTLDDIAKMKTIANVTEVVPNYSPAVNYITTEGQKKYQATVSTHSPSVSLEYAAGAVDGELAANEIILAEDYATALGFTQPADAIGKVVTIGYKNVVTQKESTTKYTVRAVSSKSGLAFRSQGSLLVSTSAAKELYETINKGSPTYGQFFIVAVRADEPENAEAIKQALIDKGYEAQTAADILGTVNTFINVLLGVLLGFGALAVLTSVFGIINTQYISVLERTQQIGLMKALGMSGRDVGLLFVFEAAWIGFLGGAIGALLAVVAGSVANPVISKTLGLDDIYLLQFVPWQILVMVISLVVISIVAGIFPSRKASRLDPIEALRTE